MSVAFYFSASVGGAYDWQKAPRPIYALMSALGFIGLYYILFKYLLAAFITTVLLGLTSFFRTMPLAAVNSLTYAVHALWVMRSLHVPNGWPLTIWVTWTIVVAFNFISPFLLPSRLFVDSAASPATS